METRKTLPGLNTAPLTSIADLLRKHPGEWVAIDKGPRQALHGRASMWRHRKPAAFCADDGAFDFATRVTKRGRRAADPSTATVKLWGRFSPRV